MIQIQYKADPSIQQALDRASPAELRKLLRVAVKTRARPALEAVKAATPVQSGKLRASWGASLFYDRGEGEIGVTIEPRSSFTFRDEEGNKRLVTRRGRAHKSVKAAMAKGLAVDRKDAWKYAYGIEFGTKPKGRLARRAGGAQMLDKGVRTGSQPFITGVSDDVFQHIVSAS